MKSGYDGVYGEAVLGDEIKEEKVEYKKPQKSLLDFR